MKKTISILILTLTACSGGSTGVSFNFDVSNDTGQIADTTTDIEVSDTSDIGKKDVIIRDVPKDSDSNIDSDNGIMRDIPVLAEGTEIIRPEIIEPTDIHVTEGIVVNDGIIVKDTVTRPDVAGCPGSAGCACAQDADCYSGLCTETSAGKICAATCKKDADCPAPLQCLPIGGQKYCVDPMPRQCMPCGSDNQCKRGDRVTGTPDAQCMPANDMKDGSYCLYQCGSGQGCGQGYACSADENSLCMPENGQCGCSLLAINLGAMTDCLATSDPSVCKGTRKCLNSGLTACVVPNISPEKCDGKDNNCDGNTDENWPDKGKTCLVGQGECKNTGTWRCKTDGSDIECDAKPGQAIPETCNGKDDDCDGVVDNNLATTECENTNQFGTCTGQKKCVSGAWKCNALVPTQEKCDGVDNNCNGKVDEDWPDKGKSCSVGQGECKNTGIWQCKADGSGVECNAKPGQAIPESCDGKDDNCDGKTDNGKNLPGCRYYCKDQDLDGYTVYDNCKCLCGPDEDHKVLKSAKKDCDDNDIKVYPGSLAKVCGKDADCNGDLMDRGEACDDGNTVDWDGCNSCLIAEFKADDQFDAHGVGDPGIAAIGGTGYVVAWPKYISNASTLKFKRFDILGHQKGSEQLAATASSGYFIAGVDACWAGPGKFVLAWMELKYNSNGNLQKIVPYLKVFNANGTAVTSAKVKISPKNDSVQYRPRLACRAGQILAVWTRQFSVPMMGTYNRANYRFFDSSGKGEKYATEMTGIGSNSFYPDATHIGNGRYAIAYRNSDKVVVDLITQKDGSYANATIASGSNIHDHVAITELGPNTFGVGWVDNGTLKGKTYQYKDKNIKSIIKDAKAISSNECANAVNPKAGTFLTTTSHYMLAWTWECKKDDNQHIRMRISNNHMVLQSQVNPAIYNTLYQEYPAVGGFKGQFMVVWDSFEDASSTDADFPWFKAVAAQRFNDKGERLYH